VIVATGSLEQHVVFRNNDLPGIALCSAVERMINLYAIKPGQKSGCVSG
jgi:sarcosine oxidase subunit alpha